MRLKESIQQGSEIKELLYNNFVLNIKTTTNMNTQHYYAVKVSEALIKAEIQEVGRSPKGHPIINLDDETRLPFGLFIASRCREANTGRVGVTVQAQILWAFQQRRLCETD